MIKWLRSFFTKMSTVKEVCEDPYAEVRAKIRDILASPYGWYLEYDGGNGYKGFGNSIHPLKIHYNIGGAYGYYAPTVKWRKIYLPGFTREELSVFENSIGWMLMKNEIGKL